MRGVERGHGFDLRRGLVVLPRRDQRARAVEQRGERVAQSGFGQCVAGFGGERAAVQRHGAVVAGVEPAFSQGALRGVEQRAHFHAARFARVEFALQRVGVRRGHREFARLRQRSACGGDVARGQL